MAILQKIKQVLFLEITFKKIYRLMFKLIGIIVVSYAITLLILVSLGFLAWLAEASARVTDIKDLKVWLNVIGAVIASLVGAYAAVYFSLWTQRKIEKEKDEENQRFAESIIDNYLRDEIKQNLSKINSLLEFFRKGQKPSNYIFRPDFSIESFDEIRYDLLKYSENEKIKEVINLYRAFKILSRYNKLSKIPNDEYHFIRKSILDNTEKYK